MKKIIYAALLAMLTSLSSPAQDFRGCRGFLDLFGGLGVGKLNDSFRIGNHIMTDFQPHVAFGLNITGGYQITEYLFAGVGFGGYTILDRYHEYVADLAYYNYDDYYNEDFPAVMLPIFVDCRWTLDLNRKINPFVDLKVGYQFRCSLDDGEILSSYSDGNCLFRSQEPGFYCMPTIGVRFGGKSAFNLGISYLSTIRQRISSGTYTEMNTLKTFTQGAFMLSLGADF